MFAPVTYALDTLLTYVAVQGYLALLRYSDHSLKSATNKLPSNVFFRAETHESGVFRGTLGGRLK